MFTLIKKLQNQNGDFLISSTTKPNAKSRLVSLGFFALPLALLISSNAQAYNRLDCYIDTREGCFNDGQTPCSRADYDFWLAACDRDYPKDSATRPPYTVRAPSQEQVNSQIYKDKMKRIKAKIFGK